MSTREFIALCSVVSVLLITSVEKMFKLAADKRQDRKGHRLQGMHMEAFCT
jgi:hypothetical protein